MLMDHGGDLSVRDKSGRTPLHRACRCHILSSVQVMVDHLADVNARDVRGKMVKEMLDKTALLMPLANIFRVQSITIITPQPIIQEKDGI